VTAPDVHLDSQSLCSKWGFSDGDMPDDLYDWCEDEGIAYVDLDWHTALRRLVREHLLPALAEHHSVEVYDIETNHNPIRASIIDGQEIDDTAGVDEAPELTPDSVTVPGEVVAAVVREVSAAGGVPSG
jgi:hypothetical protein